MKSEIISNVEALEGILKKCTFCNIAMVDNNNEPYIVPMNFGYSNGTIYLHGSKKGKKIDILKSNNRVCLSFSTDHELRWQSENMACSYSMKFRSVLAHGKVEFIEEMEEKRNALTHIMNQYSDRIFKFSDPAVKEVEVFRVVVEKLEGRVYGYKDGEG